MINCDNGLPPIFVIQPHETEQLAAARCSVSWGRKRVDSASCRRENAVFPVRRKPPMWVRGNFHALTSSRHYARRRVSERNRRKAALSAEITQEGIHRRLRPNSGYCVSAVWEPSSKQACFIRHRRRFACFPASLKSLVFRTFMKF